MMGIFRKSQPNKKIANHDGKGNFDYDIVGEKTYREHIQNVIKKFNAQANGELYIDALLVPDISNDFDENAVKVVIDSKTVGYVPRNDSKEFRDMIEVNNLAAILVKARIGWDKNSPSPLIGVRLDLDWKFDDTK